MAIVRYLLVFALLPCLAAVGSLASHCHAGVRSSTADQDGFKFVSSTPGAISKVGTFEFFPAAGEYTQVRLRTWIELVPEAIGSDAPQLVFSRYNPVFPDLSFFFGESAGTNVYTDLYVENVDPASLGVENRQSAWVNLTPAQGNQLKSLVAADPFGRVDAWLYSPTIRDFATPDEFVYYQFSPSGEITEVVTVFTATVDLVVVPEPNSCVVMGGLLLTYLGYRRKRKCPAEGALQ